MKNNNIIFWIIGIIVLVIILNYLGVIDLSQLFSVVESAESSGGSFGGGNLLK